MGCNYLVFDKAAAVIFGWKGSHLNYTCKIQNAQQCSALAIVKNMCAIAQRL